MISLVCGIQNTTQMSTPVCWANTQETDSQLPKGVEERDGLGVQACKMQTSIERMDKQPGPTVQHRELYSTSCDKPLWETG